MLRAALACGVLGGVLLSFLEARGLDTYILLPLASGLSFDITFSGVSLSPACPT